MTWRLNRLILTAAAIFLALPVSTPATDKAAVPVKGLAAKVTLAGLPRIDAPTGILMDVETGRILYSKNPHLRRPNASTTKIMTAILLIEHCKLTDRIKASKAASETPYTSLHLKAGETITAQDLITGMLVRSANDAAVAAAEYVAGNTTKFSGMMNRKAIRIGCKDTHFITPNGLYVPGHYTSVYDLCLMARYAFRYPVFNEAISTRKYFLVSRTMNKEDLAVFTHCRFLRDYPGADGVKTGYTKQARKCFVGSATRGGWRLVSAVLGSSDAGKDTAAMMDYGFATFQPTHVVSANQKCADAPVLGGWHSTVSAVAEKDLNVPVKKTGGEITTKPEFIPVRAPIRPGTKLGKLQVLVDGQPAAAVGLIAGEYDGISFARRAWIVTKWGGLVALCLLGLCYARAFAKGSRGRGRRLPPSMRGNYRRG